jgi:hypothetical protein
MSASLLATFESGCAQIFQGTLNRNNCWLSKLNGKYQHPALCYRAKTTIFSVQFKWLEKWCDARGLNPHIADIEEF